YAIAICSLWFEPFRAPNLQRSLSSGTLALVRKERADEFAMTMLSIIENLRKEGVTYRTAIADQLNERGIAGGKAGKWYANILERLAAAQLMRSKPKHDWADKFYCCNYAIFAAGPLRLQCAGVKRYRPHVPSTETAQKTFPSRTSAPRSGDDGRHG